jgi:hypothetical protein
MGSLDLPPVAPHKKERSQAGLRKAVCLKTRDLSCVSGPFFNPSDSFSKM